MKTKLNPSKKKRRIGCWLIVSQQQKGSLAHVFCRRTSFSCIIVSAQIALMKRDDVDIEGGWKIGEP